MKNKILLLLLTLVLTTFSACNFREISPNGFTPGEDDMILLSVDIDWTELGETPTGMTILFYPSDGRPPIMRLSNEVLHYECLLPEDDYTILAYNQSENEYASLKFKGLDDIENAEVHIIEDPSPENRIDRLYKLGKITSRAVTQSSSMKRNLAAALKKGSASRAKTQAASMKAKLLTNKMSISVEVENLQKATRARSEEKSINEVVAVNGALTGLAYGYMLGEEKFLEESLTHELDEWEIHFAETDGGIGYVNTEFRVFGISPLIRSNAADKTEEDVENILYLNFRLSDGTYVPYRFIVTDRIIEHVLSGGYASEIKLELHIGIRIPGVDDGLDDPIVLPDTGYPYGGIQLEVKDWGEPIEENIILK